MQTSNNRIRRWRLPAVLAAVAWCGFAFGDAPPPPPQALDAPPPPPPLQSGEALEPEVTIRRTERETIYEYRRNGQLFLVRVQPRFGPPYHFVDVNGDGALDYRPGEPVQDNIQQWILWRW